jgi:hypothetical protein
MFINLFLSLLIGRRNDSAMPKESYREEKVKLRLRYRDIPVFYVNRPCQISLPDWKINMSKRVEYTHELDTLGGISF